MERRAFTLIELLVSCAIIGMLAAIMSPAIQDAREAARRVGCTNSIRKMVLAAQPHRDGQRDCHLGSQASSHAPSIYGAFDRRRSREGRVDFTPSLPCIEQQTLSEVGVIGTGEGQCSWNNSQLGRGGSDPNVQNAVTLICPTTGIAIPASDTGYVNSYGTQHVSHNDIAMDWDWHAWRGPVGNGRHE